MIQRNNIFSPVKRNQNRTGNASRCCYFRMLVLTPFLFAFHVAAVCQQATWIWYPGDFEINLANKVQNRRTERNTFFPVFWKMDAHYVLIDFHKDFELKEAQHIEIAAEGTYNVKLDGKAFEGQPIAMNIPPGKHRINIKVYNQAEVPAVFVKGKTLVSDSSWLVTFEDKEWIDETGKTSDVSATQWMHAGYWNFNTAKDYPSSFRLPLKTMRPVSSIHKNNTVLLDFGKETFGFIRLHGARGKGIVNIYYGESREEALSPEHCEALDRIAVNSTSGKLLQTKLSKAFRYVHIQYDAAVSVDSVTMLYEYAAVKDRGSFICSDSEINRIDEVARYTLHLNTREFFIDGIKRDRWIWSGDAQQSYLMNYYSFFDKETVARTLLALRGKDPVTAHINTIMDYTFYWFTGIYDYYLYTGDQGFIKQLYPGMKTLMDYCLKRRDKDGLMEGLPGDWIFIDWADRLSKKGEVSFEQLLFFRSLETMALCAGISNEKEDAALYTSVSADVKKKLFDYYWNNKKQAFVHSRVDGQPTDNITRYTNMFAVFLNYLNPQQKEAVKKSVLLNDSIQKITTPYMRFYELEALCALGEQDYVLKEIKNYWGGMLQLGATSFWEAYDPSKRGAEHYAMYGREFGKSLCHAWGASPIYLLGKYYLGIQPVTPGYKTYLAAPVLGGLKWIQGEVPTPDGNIELYCSKTQIKIKGAAGEGTLRFKSSIQPVCGSATIQSKGNQVYELTIEKGVTYTISYNSAEALN